MKTSLKGSPEKHSPTLYPRRRLRTAARQKLESEPITPVKSRASLSDDESVTPPKLRRGNENEPPPLLQTPSTLLNNLTLDSPLKAGCFTPKSLFGSPYQKARRALHSTVPKRMPGRDKELQELRSFITGCVQDGTSASLYISGPPGTGKTAALSVILQEMQDSELKKVFVNCTAIKSSKAIYLRIVTELNLKIGGKTEKDHILAIENHLRKSHKMILLVLDEIDQLDSKNQSVLYTIFEWPARQNSKLILIGIANALDLTDRILPRLQARCELKPKLMHFTPYSKQQIVEIITDRLQESEASNVFSPVAVQMLAGKVAAVSGDVRRALDIGRRVVELAEQNENNKTVLQPLDNVAASEKQNSENLEVVDLKQVVGVLNNVYGTSQNLSDDSEDSFPLQQKIAVCSLLLILNKSKNKDVTIGRLHDIYKRICQRRNVSVIDQAEFVGVCSLLETRGIIRVTGKKEPRLHKVTLEWDQEEVIAALRDKQLTSAILEDDRCLGKL